MPALRLTVLCMLLAAAGHAQQAPIQLRVDLTDAPRQLLHVTEVLPAHPGDNRYSYPEWLPGQELPGGPIDNLTGLFFHAGSTQGPALQWRRDPIDMYSFHIDAPAGVTSIAASFDILEVPSRANTTATKHFSSHVAMLEPSDVVLYPTGTPAHQIAVTATVHLPAGWQAATALRPPGVDHAALNGSDTTFQPVSLEQFVDSPILAGDHCRQYPLAPEVRPAHTLDVCADSSADLNLQPALLEHMADLVRQATALFQSHHYAHYDFLVAASTHLDGDSEEHTESADYVVKNLDLTEPDGPHLGLGYLLPHEYIHSWCGKYRRPAPVATPDFRTPMQNGMLWVYEGLTEYYGIVLAARSGFRTTQQALTALDQEVFHVDKPGRRWRSVQDSADASSILRGTSTPWSGWRMSQDYYYAGTLLWLEADMKIRELTNGARSLDDFAAAFLGANPDGSHGDSPAGIYPHSFQDVVSALNATAAYDWAGFWTTRLNGLTTEPPIAGYEAAGYTYTYSKSMNPDEAAFLKASHSAEMYHSLGLGVSPDGTVGDVFVGSPAYIAGLGPGDRLTLVDGRPYSADALAKAVTGAEGNTKAILLTAERDDETATYRIDYHGGEKYSVLVRNKNPDVLTTGILAPKAR